MTAVLPHLATAETVSDQLGLPKWRIYELVREGAVPHVRIGRSVRFDLERLAAWLEAGGTGAVE